MKTEQCVICGSPVRLVGSTTKHYEPIANEIIERKDREISALKQEILTLKKRGPK